jgi:hypothetical protein
MCEPPDGGVSQSRAAPFAAGLGFGVLELRVLGIDPQSFVVGSILWHMLAQDAEMRKAFYHVLCTLLANKR